MKYIRSGDRIFANSHISHVYLTQEHNTLLVIKMECHFKDINFDLSERYDSYDKFANRLIQLLSDIEHEIIVTNNVLEVNSLVLKLLNKEK